MLIITNNPLVTEKYPDIVNYIDCDIKTVFNKVRDMIHKEAKLVSYPLSGSLKPHENPFKSIIVTTNNGKADFKSLQIIEDSLVILERYSRDNFIEFSKCSSFGKYDKNENLFNDYAVIDLDLVSSAFMQM